MRKLICTILLWTVSSIAATSGPLPEAAKSRLDVAGIQLSAATTPKERVAALRELDSVLSDYPESEEARALAQTISQQVTIEAGPSAMLDALGDLAQSGEIRDADAYGAIIAPIFETVIRMHDDGTLLPSTAIALDDAIKKLDAEAKKANLPTVAEAISKVTGDPNIGATVRNSLGRIATLAQLARDVSNLDEMNEAETKKFIDRYFILFPAAVAPALGAGGGVILRDTLAWNMEMFHESSKAMDLVSEAMRTGEFNTEEYNKISDRLKSLSAGPWGSSTAKDFLKSLCKAIPAAGAWCDDAFKVVEELISGVDCEAITCDCENVGGGLMRGPLIVQCEIAQQSLISECQATQTVTGSCQSDAAGPGASH